MKVHLHYEPQPAQHDLVFTPDDGEPFYIRLSGVKPEVAAFIVRACNSHEALCAALEAFTRTINATGGVETDRKGYTCPVADPEWIDLGDAFDKATAALKLARGES